MAHASAPAAIRFGMLVLSCACSVAASAAPPPRPSAEATASAREAAVVHGGAGEQTAVVGQLAKGDLVTIDIELDGDDGHWCKVIRGGDTAPLGYVYCSSLERKAARTKWTRVATRGAADAAASAAQGEEPPAPSRPAADAAKRPYSDVKVQIYLTRWCQYSAKALALLRTLGVSIDEYDIERDAPRRAELIARTGHTTVPFIDVEGITVPGFSDSAIREAVEKRRAAH